MSEIVEIHPLDFGKLLNAAPEGSEAVVNANDTVTLEGVTYRQSIEAAPQSDEAKALEAELAAVALATGETAVAAAQELAYNPELLDNALEDEAQAEAELDSILAKQESEPEVSETPVPEKIFDVQIAYQELLARVTTLEQRIEEHNVRSGHKI